MQELEKILEEMKESSIMVATSKEHYIHPQDGRFVEEVVLLNDVEEIIRKHMNDGWISVEERLPMRTLDEKINESYQKYLVFIDGVDGWDIDIAVYDFWNDKKWREAHDGYGEIENVIAWRPLPEPYRPERSVEE